MKLPIALLLLAAPTTALAQPRATETTTYHGRTRQLDVAIPRVAVLPAVDGRLDDPSWEAAALLTGFSQYTPVDRQAADDSTEVRVMYSDHAIYFGIRAFEPHGAVTATLADRDRIGSNDHVELYLDTFHDRRRSLLFAVNALGIQSDGTFIEGAGIDRSPDFRFESKGRVTDFGYEVEVRIPFSAIRYQQTAVQQWGIQVLRRVMHSGQEQTWTPAERGAPSFLEQSGKLLGLTDLKRGLVMDINPVMTASAPGAPVSTTDPTWRYRRDRPEFGGNVRWAVTPNISASGTINPDFSQVESDVGQTIFDPRQALSFPEKRPFFLEANENFQVPNSLIYTRSIVAPKAALKVSGKVGGTNVGVLTAVDDGSASEAGARNPLHNILRLRRDIGPNSTFGVVYTDRIQGDDYNRVTGIDSRVRIGSRYLFTGQVATSFTGFGAERMDGRPLFDLALSQSGRASGFSARFHGIHPEFIASSGFISRTGIARVVFQPRRTWFPKNSLIQSISFSPISDNTWEWDRFVRGTEPNDIKVNTSTNAVLRGGWGTTFYTWTETFKYPKSLYTDYVVERRDASGAVTDTVPFTGTDRLTNVGVNVRVSTPQWSRFSGAVDFSGGQDDNFDEWSSAWIYYTTIEGDWRPNDQVRVNARYLEQRVHRKSDNSLVRLRAIPRLKLEYQVSRPVFVRIVTQYDGLKVDELRDDSRTNDPVLIRTATGFRRATPIDRGGLRADWLFSYQPTPGTVFFAGYGASIASDEFRPTALERRADGFFVKWSYLIRTG